MPGRWVPGWVTVSRVQLPVPENLSHYITSHPGQLSMAIPPWVRAMSTTGTQRAVMPCSWGVKAGMVREWVAGKTVWSSCYHGPYLSASEMRFFINIKKYCYKYCYINRTYFNSLSGAISCKISLNSIKLALAHDLHWPEAIIITSLTAVRVTGSFVMQNLLIWVL